MIVAAVDDLMFAAKISTAARQLGVDVVFAKTPAAVHQEALARKPGLIIFDLNSLRVDPLTTIAALKGDPALAATRIVGFVSHVQTDLVASARAAGADEVLARSAFSAHLADILKQGA